MYWTDDDDDDDDDDDANDDDALGIKRCSIFSCHRRGVLLRHLALGLHNVSASVIFNNE